MTEQPKHPPPVKLGRLHTAADIRRAFKRLGDAVLTGTIEPKRANSAMYAVAGAAKALEIEAAERIERRANELAANPRGSTPLYRDAIDGLLEYQPATDPMQIGTPEPQQ